MDAKRRRRYWISHQGEDCADSSVPSQRMADFKLCDLKMPVFTKVPLAERTADRSRLVPEPLGFCGPSPLIVISCFGCVRFLGFPPGARCWSIRTYPAAPPIRPQRHVPNSITTIHRKLAVAIARTLPRCPCCARSFTRTTGMP